MSIDLIQIRKYEREVQGDVSPLNTDAARRGVSEQPIVAGWNSGDGRAQHSECAEHETSTLRVNSNKPRIIGLFPGDSPLASHSHLLRGNPWCEPAAVPVPGTGRAQNNFLREYLEQPD